MFELSSSDPQWSGSEGGIGERGGMRVLWLLSYMWRCLSSVSSGAGSGRSFLLDIFVFLSCGACLFFGYRVLVICVCGLLLVYGLV